MKMEEMKQTILDYLNNEWEDYYTIYTELCDIYGFQQEWTDFDYSNNIIYNEIENELNMNNIFNIIKYCEDKHNGGDEPYSIQTKHNLLKTFIEYVGVEFIDRRIDDYYSIRGSPS